MPYQPSHHRLKRLLLLLALLVCFPAFNLPSSFAANEVIDKNDLHDLGILTGASLRLHDAPPLSLSALTLPCPRPEAPKIAKFSATSA